MIEAEVTHQRVIGRGESVWLDYLRGTGLLFVVLAHLQQILICPYWCPQLPAPDRSFFWYFFQLVMPQFALMTFFSISGCLIYYSVRRNMSTFGFFNWQDYLLSRLTRLYPPLIAATGFLILMYGAIYALGLTMAADFLTGQENYIVRQNLEIDWKNIVGSLFFLNTIIPGFESPAMNGPLWSLAHEFWFYLMGMIFVVSYQKRKWIGLVFLVTSSAVAWGIMEFWFYGWLVWIISFGMTHLENSERKGHVVKVSLIGSALFFGLWIWCVTHYNDSWYDNRGYFFLGTSFSFFLPLILRMVRTPNPVVTFTGRLLIGVSSISYTTYLFHFPWFIFVFASTNRAVSGWSPRLFIAAVALGFIFWISGRVASLAESHKLRQSLKRALKTWSSLRVRRCIVEGAQKD